MLLLERAVIPEFGSASAQPALRPSEYESRLAATVAAMCERDLDVLVVYGDREHSANLAFLTGLDPRFEEALLLLDRNGRRLFLLGNEDIGYLDPDGPELEVELFQDLSLLGQSRAESRPLETILSEFGVGRGQRVGCAGWKYFADPRGIEIPAYVVDLLRELVGRVEPVVNATEIFMDAQDGLRVINSAGQLACFEYAATRTSAAVAALVDAIEVGKTERELANLLVADGLPLSCHPMVSTGEKVERGLSSPSDRRVALGDPFVTAFGVAGGLTCRAGCVARGPGDLSAELRDFFPRYVANYFEIVATWYRNVRVGATGGEVFAAVEAVRDSSLLSFLVNPGHQLHLDEWVHSPFAEGSTTELRSGMALQMDIIPVSAGPHCYTNVEDGVVLADEALRGELQRMDPDLWQRVESRRAFMRDGIGIALDPSVLPVGNLPAALAPYLLEPRQLCVAKNRD